MKNRVKSIMWLLLLGISTTLLVQSCQKEPPVDPCRDAPCDLHGYIAYETNGCTVPPTGRIGIMGDDGNFYLINTDHTGQFNNYPVGTYVTFGLCPVKDVDKGMCGTYNIWSPPTKEGDLRCIQEAQKPGDPELCSQIAEVVAVSYEPNGVPTSGPYLNIEGNVYAVQGDLAAEFQTYAIGTHVMVSASKVEGCFLPTVMTYPGIAGCVTLECIRPLVLTIHH
jgi:hypothetical protein